MEREREREREPKRYRSYDGYEGRMVASATVQNGHMGKRRPPNAQ